MSFKKMIISTALIASAVMAGTQVDSLFSEYISSLSGLSYSEYKEGEAQKGIDLISQGADVNGSYSNYGTEEFTFIGALKKEQFKVALEMAKNGTDLTMKGKEYGEPVISFLTNTISKNETAEQIELLKLVLKKSDITEPYTVGSTTTIPLVAAAYAGFNGKDMRILNVLMDQGISFNLTYKQYGFDKHLASDIIRMDNSSSEELKEFQVKMIKTEKALPQDFFLYLTDFPEELIETAIKKGADINYADEDGTKPDAPVFKEYRAKQASHSDNLAKDYLATTGTLTVKEAKKALKKGADINAVSETGMTPLKAAIAELNIELVKYYLDEGVTVNVVTKTDAGEGAEFLTAVSVYPNDESKKAAFREIVKLLATKETDFSGNIGYMFTPIQTLISQGEVELAKYCIELGADPHHLVNEEAGAVSLLMLAASSFANVPNEAVLYALELDQYKNSVADGISLLSLAAGAGNQAVIDALMEHGASFTNDPSTDMTPLLSAAYANQIEMVQTIIAAGVDINQTSAKGWTALTIAANKGHTELVSQLLEKGADVHKTFTGNKSALFLTSQRGHTDIAKILIEHGADINKFADNEWSPLMEAAERGYTEMITYFLEKGADSTYAMSDGQTAYSIAMKNGHTDTAALLQ